MPEGPFKKLGREVRSMDSSIVTALSAILGSLVGGSASIATAWITQKTQSRRELVITEIRKRELLYTEFIDECSKLAIDALDHTLDDTTKFFHVYTLQSRIRLTSSDMVVTAAEQTVKHISKELFRA
jgi:ribosome-interacting GTPase 1